MEEGREEMEATRNEAERGRRRGAKKRGGRMVLPSGGGEDQR